VLYAFAHQFYWDFRRLAEGGYRWKLDRREYERLASGTKNIRISKGQQQQLREQVESEVRAGRLRPIDRADSLHEAEQSQLAVEREFSLMEASRMATRQLKIPGEPDVLGALLRARTPRQVRKICSDAYVSVESRDAKGNITVRERLNWPISLGSVLPMYLSQHAAQFIAAKQDPRFPRSNRSTSQYKQLWFLSRALAGAVFGVQTRTAINLVGSKRPEQVFEESRASKPLRKRPKLSGQLLTESRKEANPS
jgi:hypothetical protein